MVTDTIVIYEDDCEIIKKDFDKLLSKSLNRVFSKHIKDSSQHEIWRDGYRDELDIKYFINQKDPTKSDRSPNIVRIEIIYTYSTKYSTFQKNLFELLDLDVISQELKIERVIKAIEMRRKFNFEDIEPEFREERAKKDGRKQVIFPYYKGGGIVVERGKEFGQIYIPQENTPNILVDEKTEKERKEQEKRNEQQRKLQREG